MTTVAEKLDSLPPFTTKSRRILKGHQGKVLAIDWSNDKRHMVSTSQDGKLIVWDAFTINKEVCTAVFKITLMIIFNFLQACDYYANNLGFSLCLFPNCNHCCMRVNYIRKKNSNSIIYFYRGLDNKVTLYPLNMDDDANKYKKVVATHANYISACKFMHSDQQVIN